MADMIDGIFDRSLPALGRTLTLCMRRGEAITSNMANAETPGYKAVDLNFSGELERAFGADRSQLARTHGKHLDTGGQQGAHLVADNSGVMKADGNNVDLDIQMANMVSNAGRYGRTASIVYKKLHILRMAIMRAQS